MDSPINEDVILEVLADVVDPEINMPILEMGEDDSYGLIDEINISDNKSIEVKYHATTPYCPPIFAMQISNDIKSRIKSLKGADSVKVLVSGHMMSDQINQRINPEE
ncbi:MAG: iron-sulfur cluster assembly protein [Thaumarchaeota archaeon]|nr:iron-sulfur cluster assembly protein [Nitrososphaerota archaeon]